MIEAQGGLIPLLCHIFLIFFGGFMSLSLILNPNFVKTMGFETSEARFIGQGLGFSLLAITLVFIATLFSFGSFQSTYEVYVVLFLFTSFSALRNTLEYFKILDSLDGKPVPISNVIRPLIPVIVILIRAFTLA